MPVVIGSLGDPQHGISVGVEVRHDMRDIVAFRFAAMGAVHLDFAEIAREGELLSARQELAREDDDMVRKKGAPDRVLQFGRKGLGQLNTGYPHAARRCKLLRP
jgi:hypothetical protein